ncbi:hypothetical protein EON63_19160, partial [archaeon]
MSSGLILPITGSIDLSMTKRPLVLTPSGVALSCEQDLLTTWDEVEEISESTNNCFALYDDGSQPWKVATMSTVSNYAASLCPPLDKPGAPTLLLGGKTVSMQIHVSLVQWRNMRAITYTYTNTYTYTYTYTCAYSY